MSHSTPSFGQSTPSGPHARLNINSARRFLTKQFEQIGLGDCEAEARDLIIAATGLAREELITRGAELISPEAIKVLEHYSARRLSGEPIDHILGWREFYGRRFKINSDVLSPRQETEEVLAKALELITDIQTPHILDLGTGSGAIAITLLSERLDAVAVAVDVSEAALKIANSNAKLHAVQSRLTLSASDWFEHVSGQFDLVISNPPYIDGKAMKELPHEVAKFDPELALHGGADGLSAYRLIASQVNNYLKPSGQLVLEIGYDQHKSVPQILRDNAFNQIAYYTDLFGNPRIVTARAKDLI